MSLCNPCQQGDHGLCTGCTCDEAGHRAPIDGLEKPDPNSVIYDLSHKVGVLTSMAHRHQAHLEGVRHKVENLDGKVSLLLGLPDRQDTLELRVGTIEESRKKLFWAWTGGVTVFTLLGGLLWKLLGKLT